METIRSIQIPDNPRMPQRSTTVISLLAILVTIPSLFADITEALCQATNSQLPTVVKLMNRARELRLALRKWYQINVHPDGALKNSAVVCAKPYNILVLYRLCSIYSNRLNTSIFWTGTQGIEEMEEETQEFSRILVSLSKSEAYKDLQSSLLLAQKLPIAEAIIESGDFWKAELANNKNTAPGQLFKMPVQSFSKWCRLFGRATS
jgi:hypothetical protein